MASEIRFVQEIEKHEIIYNNTLPEYSRKDLSEAAWVAVAENTEMKVSECKEKWRNIRSSLLRSFKPSDKVRKPYYLTPYLTFVIPFMKPLSNEHRDDSVSGKNRSEDKNEPEYIVCSIKGENSDAAMLEAAYASANEGFESSVSHYDPLYQPESPSRKRKCTDDVSSRKKCFDERETHMSVDNIPKNNTESLRYFLMSLLPELETMTEEQSRLFKIKVMMLIGDIKSNFEQCQAEIPSLSETNCLQKRLIKLLLKNLENTI